jgi:hypothetical protein
MNGQRSMSFAEMGRDRNKFARMRKRQGHCAELLVSPNETYKAKKVSRKAK